MLSTLHNLPDTIIYGNMAAGKIFLNNVLCNLFKSCGKMPLKTLKSILVDFFQPSDITVVKKLLHEQTKLLEMLEHSTKLLYIADWRGGEGYHLQAIVHSVFTLIAAIKGALARNVTTYFGSDLKD